MSSGGASPRSRADRWRGRTLEGITEQVADDLDEIEREQYVIKKDVQSIKRILVSVLISTTIAALLLAANLAVGVGR